MQYDMPIKNNDKQVVIPKHLFIIYDFFTN